MHYGIPKINTTAQVTGPIFSPVPPFHPVAHLPSPEFPAQTSLALPLSSLVKAKACSYLTPSQGLCCLHPSLRPSASGPLTSFADMYTRGPELALGCALPRTCSLGCFTSGRSAIALQWHPLITSTKLHPGLSHPSTLLLIGHTEYLLLHLLADGLPRWNASSTRKGWYAFCVSSAWHRVEERKGERQK
jgi:hypothetical protein